MQWAPGTFSVVRRTGREIKNATSSRAGVKDKWTYTTNSLLYLHNVDRDNFIFQGINFNMTTAKKKKAKI